eukprot:COSAG02_NODE_618_length_19461_cov_39.117447_3_plen_90_part_00
MSLKCRVQLDITRYIDIDIDIFGFIIYIMYGITRVLLSPPPPLSSLSRSGTGVGISLPRPFTLAKAQKLHRSARTPPSGLSCVHISGAY